MDEITAEEIAANYAAMLIVANRINKIVAARQRSARSQLMPASGI
jgi:hypothetical protein